jgi:maltose O-acetyltransferase
MFGRGALLPFTPDLFKPLVAKLFGAKIGKGVAMGGIINEPPLVSVGDYAILGQYSVITPHAISSGKINLGKIAIGDRATVGVGAVIMPGVEIGDGAMVMPNTFVPMNMKIPAGEIWGGNPITKIRASSTA